MVNLKYTSHPYCIYTRTKRVIGDTQFGKFRFNNYGFNSSEDTDFVKSKIRIMCIGGSTTELGYGDDVDNTYPGWLQKHLGNKYEVLNAGVSGYTTAEMLISFQLTLIDFNPDFVVIYESINDVLYAGMLTCFESDYSHNRINIGMTLGDKNRTCLTQFINNLPLVPANSYPDVALRTFRRNLNSICAIANRNNIRPIIVKFNYNPDIDTSEVVYPLNELGMNNKKDVFLDGLRKNIGSLRDVANENNAVYIETEPLVSCDFIDSCHFKTSGMQKMGRSIAEVITNIK